MENLTAKVQEILGSEEGMNQLKELAQMLGLSDGSDSAPSGNSPDVSKILSGLSSHESPSEKSSLNAASLAKIGGLFRNMQQDTPASAFLRALRPLLRTERQKKVDDAVRLMQLLSLVPLLQQSGILSAILDGQAESR